MTDSEIIAVVQAHAAGKKIQCNDKNRQSDWWDVTSANWDFSEYDFRVAPEPRQPREWFIHIPDDRLGGTAKVYPGTSKEHAVGYVCGMQCVRVREVIE